MTMRDTLTDDAVRRHPSDAFIEQVRSRFPTEAEVDVVLTRKMRRRNGPSFQAVPLETLIVGVERLIADRLGYDIRVEGA